MPARRIRVVQQVGRLVVQLALPPHLHETHAVLRVQRLALLCQERLRDGRRLAAVRPHPRIELCVVVAPRSIEELLVVRVSDLVELAASLLEVGHPAQFQSHVPLFGQVGVCGHPSVCLLVLNARVDRPLWLVGDRLGHLERLVEEFLQRLRLVTITL